KQGATGNTIGGTAAGAGNVISGNTGAGITLTDSGTTANVVAGNFIGTNAAGNGLISSTVSWFKAEGNANDAVGGNNGTLFGNVTFTTGEVGQAFQFDGSGAVISLPNTKTGTLDITGTALTIESWVNQTDASQANNASNSQTIFDKFFNNANDGYR